MVPCRVPRAIACRVWPCSRGAQPCGRASAGWGTIPPECLPSRPTGTFTGMTDISSRARRRLRFICRLPAHCGDHYGSEAETEIGLDPHGERDPDPGLLAESGQDISLAALGVPTPFRDPIVTGGNGVGLLCIVHVRRHARRRSFSVRVSSSRPQRVPRPGGGHAGGSMLSPHAASISGPFPRIFFITVTVPGPSPDRDGQGPGTHARHPEGTPPNSCGKGALLRCVARRVGSGYVLRSAYDTRDLSSCLANPTGQITQLRGRCDDR